MTSIHQLNGKWLSNRFVAVVVAANIFSNLQIKVFRKLEMLCCVELSSRDRNSRYFCLYLLLYLSLSFPFGRCVCMCHLFDWIGCLFMLWNKWISGWLKQVEFKCIIFVFLFFFLLVMNTMIGRIYLIGISQSMKINTQHECIHIIQRNIESRPRAQSVDTPKISHSCDLVLNALSFRLPIDESEPAFVCLLNLHNRFHL